MNYIDQWNALSSRIKGLVQAGTLHAQYLQVNSSDSYSSAKRLRDQGKDILNELTVLQTGYSKSLPLAAFDAIEKFRNNTGSLILKEGITPDAAQQQVWAFLIAVAAFDAELSFLLSDNQESIRTRSERAFHHLQRSIVADDEFRNKWQKAFEEGEISCEKLGAVHLLLHGIWAFKVNAAGERTDLVFQEPAELENIQRYVSGLVLTEWKKAVTDSDANQCFQEARAQAKRYSQGALRGTELTAYRYAVVVSKHQVKIPADVKEGDVVYRHFNIAVEPRVPSKS